MENVKDNGQRLVDLLKFDPAKEPQITSDAFADVLAGIKVERQEKAKALAKDVILKASELRSKMVKARKEFEKNEAAFNKELGKLLKQLEAAVNGQPLAEDEGQTQNQ